MRFWQRYSSLAGFDLTTPRATYILRALLAANLALVIAYWLQLDMPYSAASTVLLVLNPVQGAVLGKGKWRLIGTLVGMVMALTLMAAFAQQPWLFVLTESLWLGLCVLAMSVLRHFRASGAAVAGYTIGLATLGAIQHPDLAFEHAIGRASTVAVGVITLGLVSALFSRRSLAGKLEAQLLRLATTTATLLHSAPAVAGLAPQQKQLLAEIYSLDDLLAAGRAESPVLAQQAQAIRHAMELLFVIVSDPAPHPVWQPVAQALSTGLSGVSHARQLLLQAQPADLAQQMQRDNFLTLLRVVQQVGRTPLRHSWPSVGFHRDWPGALRNGARACVTLLLAASIWIVSGWSNGDIMLLVIAPYCALLSTAPHPAAGAQKFLRGTLYAIPLALICAFVVLPLINGLPLLLLVLSLFWLPGIYATSFPQHMLSGLAYLVGFNTLTAASNPMVYDVAQFFNWSLAWLMGTVLTLLAFQLMPRRPERSLARLREHIRHSSCQLLAGHRAPLARWQQHQQHRIAQLGTLMRADPQQDRVLQQALASLHLGRELLRLQQLSHDPIIGLTLQRMARRATNPRQAARHAQRAAQRLSNVPNPPRQVASLTGIAALLTTHARYFAGEHHVE